jgi:hypothetical protein
MLARCMRSAIAFGRGVELVAYARILCSFWSLDFSKVEMYLPSGLWIITSFCEVGCCVIIVEPVGIA